MKNPKRSGNPATKAAAMAAGPQPPDPRQLFEAAFRDVVGSLLMSGWRLIDPKGADATDKLAEELGVELPQPEAAKPRLILPGDKKLVVPGQLVVP